MIPMEQVCAGILKSTKVFFDHAQMQKLLVLDKVIIGNHIILQAYLKI